VTMRAFFFQELPATAGAAEGTGGMGSFMVGFRAGVAATGQTMRVRFRSAIAQIF